MKPSPSEKIFDILCDALSDIDRLPKWDRMNDQNVSILTLGVADVLYATHVLKHENKFQLLWDMGYCFYTNKNGTYVVTEFPSYMVGQYTWDFTAGALFFDGKQISE